MQTVLFEEKTFIIISSMRIVHEVHNTQCKKEKLHSLRTIRTDSRDTHLYRSYLKTQMEHRQYFS